MNNINFWHRVQLPDGTYTPGRVNHGPDGGDWPTTRFGMPIDLTGKSVLDIGAWDGFFSFEAEKRGAAVILASNPPLPKGPDLAGIRYLKDALQSNVDIVIGDIENTVDRSDTYDVVLFYGVLYHLKSPLVAMDNVAKLTAPGGICLLETAMVGAEFAGVTTPVLEYRPHAEGDPTNFFYPNESWIMVAAMQAGFKKIERVHTMGSRSTYRMSK